MEKGNIHKHCSTCFDAQCPKSINEEACSVIPCRWKCGAFFHSCKSSEHNIICPKFEEEDEFEWMLRGVTNLDARRRKKKETKAQLKPLDDFFKGPGEPARRIFQKGKKIPVPPEPPPQTLLKNTGLDATIETVTRLQTKPKAMYTFVCSQEFRRDEYAHHCQVVHDEIIGGLNNWVEDRCPLSYLGCGFTNRRLFPGPSSTLIFSPAVESFGITQKDVKALPATTGDDHKSLIDLPLELLLDIITYLDSFSISNLAVVSVYLRQVCSFLLDTRGLVTLEWQRRCIPDSKRGVKTSQWQISHKRWFFSTSLGPVESWTFSKNEGAVSEHLKECPYNVKTKHVDAKKLDTRWPAVMHSVKEKLSKRQLR